AKKVVFQVGPARRPFGLVAREKIFLTLRVSVFFHGKPCRRPPKNKLGKAQEITNKNNREFSIRRRFSSLFV
ncbi:hypothetical protein, partial [Parabacteroides johnsonii]|uniref:hypothetical protein n=1 Tax=Parabacteroides johnsonii TaxID=387661 RepID=UPI001C9E897B